jgi:hypothetical protein
VERDLVIREGIGQSPGDRPEVGEADGFDAVGFRLVESEDAGWFHREIVIDVLQPALPVAAIGFQLAAFDFVEAREERGSGAVTCFREDAFPLVLEDLAHAIRLEAATFSQASFGIRF